MFRKSRLSLFAIFSGFSPVIRIKFEIVLNKPCLLNSDNASISNSSNRTTHNVDSYVKTCLESPDKQIFPSLNNKSQWNASQPLFPSPVTPPPPPPDEKIMSPEEKAIIKRKNIVNEIYHTEMNYVDFLRRLKVGPTNTPLYTVDPGYSELGHSRILLIVNA